MVQLDDVLFPFSPPAYKSMAAMKAIVPRLFSLTLFVQDPLFAFSSYSSSQIACIGGYSRVVHLAQVPLFCPEFLKTSLAVLPVPSFPLPFL